MKLLLLLLLISSVGNAETTLMTGALTYHMFDSSTISRHYEGKLADNGRLIYNPMLAIRRTTRTGDTYDSWSAFGGLNSIHKPMGGGLVETGWLLGPKFEAGLVFGGYIQDRRPFLARGVAPIALFSAAGVSYIPIGGVNLTIKHKSVNLTTIVTPLLTTTFIGYTF